MVWFLKNYLREIGEPDNRKTIGHPAPNQEAIAKPVAGAANDSSAITGTGGRGPDLASTAASCVACGAWRAPASPS